MKYLCNDNKDSLDAPKKEEETPEKKIDFVSRFIGSIFGNVIPIHLLNTYTAIFFVFQILLLVKNLNFFFFFFVKEGKINIQLLKGSALSQLLYCC